MISNAMILLFSVAFISFFFLKDGDLLLRIIYSLTPDRYMNNIQNILRNALKILTRYFIGLIIQISAVTTLTSLGLWLVGVENAFLIGFLAGLMNLIPYAGPVIGAGMGLLIVASTNLTSAVPQEFSPLLLKAGGVFLIVQLIDNFVFQPLIFSNSAQAHPLEIFIVISVAGTMAGITGMMLAVPVYSFIRIVAREFLSEFKVVDRLTRNME
jgi:predicted PurR-regulated permease PerM